MKYVLDATIATVVILLCFLANPASAAERVNTGAPLYEPAVAQPDSADVIRSRFLIQIPGTIRYRVTAVSLPVASLSSPTAYGADFRDVFAMAVYQQRTRYASGPDGALGIGFGLGDASRLAGLEVVLTNFNVFVEQGRKEVRDLSLSAKLHRRIGPELSFAVGVENAAALRGQLGDSGPSYYGVVTRTFHTHPASRVMEAVTISAGLGNGRFRSEYHNGVQEDYRITAFGSAALRFSRAVSVVADWNGLDLGAGLSIAPIKQLPLVATAGFADLTGRVGDGARFIVGIGCGYSF